MAASAALASRACPESLNGGSTGKVQLGVDCSVVLAALRMIDPLRVLQSVLGAVAVSAILVLNHRPERYLGVCPPHSTLR